MVGRESSICHGLEENGALGVHDAKIIKLDLGPKDLLSRCYDLLLKMRC